MQREALWIWLACKCGVGNKEILTLIESFESIEKMYEADYDTYANMGISERLCEDLCDKSLDEANGIIANCQSHRIGILCYDDQKYPSALRSIKDPPAVLYYIGILPDFNNNLCISVVGTRKMSEYGMRAAYKISYELACSGAFVVSGMALGIDGVASAAALAAGGKVVAVLGCGADVVYPKEHNTLCDKIRRNGVVLTEYPPSTPPRGYNFPVRNRIISGLSQATVVVDADVDSGAMITAKNAVLQGRDIYAVPSNIDSLNSSGTNSLIRDGAQAALCGNDIIKHYSFAFGGKLNQKRLYDDRLNSEFDPSVLAEMGVGARSGDVGNADSKGSYVKSAARKSRKIEAHKTAEEAKVQDGRESAYMKALQSDTPNKKENVAPEESRDLSREALESLSEKQRRVFEEMPLDFPVTVDYLTKTGMKLGEVISALTVLEIKGLVSSLPGAIYIRK